MINISSVISVAEKAGNAILNIFNENELDVKLKKDNSPVQKQTYWQIKLLLMG